MSLGRVMPSGLRPRFGHVLTRGKSNAQAEVRAKAEALDNSVSFNVHRWSDYPEIKSAVQDLFKELSNDLAFIGREKLKKKHITVVILNLWAAWLADKNRYVAYSRSKSEYLAGSRYNELHISFVTIAVVDALNRSGYIDHHLGFYDKARPHFGRNSRMRATEKLIELIQTKHKASPAAIGQSAYAECIVLRDAEKRDIEYEETPETQQMRAVVRTYNDVLEKAVITLPDAPAEGIPTEAGRPMKIDFQQKFVRRIFNNESWSDGGRFYGGWWQSLSQEWRSRISIEGSQGSVEVDYDGFHICLLYALQGLDYWSVSNEKDPYTLKGYEGDESVRSLVKQVFLSAINAGDQSSALRGVQSEMNSNLKEYEWFKESPLSLRKIADEFGAMHQPIAKYLSSGCGVKLQRVESDIAERIIKRFTQQKVPVLCIHDSFVINPDHASELKKTMMNAFEEQVSQVTGKKIGPRLTATYPIYWSATKHSLSEAATTNFQIPNCHY